MTNQLESSMKQGTWAVAWKEVVLAASLPTCVLKWAVSSQGTGRRNRIHGHGRGVGNLSKDHNLGLFSPQIKNIWLLKIEQRFWLWPMSFEFSIFCLPQGQIQLCWDTKVLWQPGQCISFVKGRTTGRKVAIPLLIPHFQLPILLKTSRTSEESFVPGKDIWFELK